MGLIGDIFNAVMTPITNAQNRKENQHNRAFNAQQAQLQRDWQEEQYLKYSSPSAMVQQYKDAGLNPALAYNGGQGTVFSGSSASSGSSIPNQIPSTNFDGISQLITLIDNLKNTKAQRALTKAQTETEQAKKDNFASDTVLKSIDSQTRAELNSINIASISQSIQESLNRISNDNKRVENEAKHINGILSQIESSNLVNAKQIEEIDANIKYMFKQGALSEEQQAYYAAQTVLLGYKQATEEKVAELTDSQKHYFDAQKKLSNSQSDYTEEQREKLIKDAWEQDFRNKFLYLYGTYPENRYISYSYGVVAKDWLSSKKDRETVSKVKLNYDASN